MLCLDGHVLESPFLSYVLIIAVQYEIVLRFEQSHTVLFESHASHMIVSLRLIRDCDNWNANRWRLMSLQLRPCCAESHWIRESHESNRFYNNYCVNGGNTTCCVSYIDLTNFCHFLADPSVYGSHLWLNRG